MIFIPPIQNIWTILTFETKKNLEVSIFPNLKKTKKQENKAKKFFT